MNRVGAVVTLRGDVEPFEETECLQEVRALCPGAALADGAATIVRGRRLLDARDVLCQVGVADQAAVRFGPGGELMRERTAIEVVGNETKAAAAVGRLGLGI